jgi:hypothetical protein
LFALPSSADPARGSGEMMTATLLLFVSVALLALVSGVCFVGCVLDTSGLGLGFTTYSDDDVIKNPDCVAFWPLSDSPGQTTALDVVGKAKMNPHNGSYFSVASSDPTIKNLFPCPQFTVDPAGPLDSAFAPGTLTIGAPGIVTGDTLPPHDPKNPISTTCMQADGGFVAVPFNSTVNPASAFTIEAWVLPGWDANAPQAYRTVIDSRSQGGGLFFGYVIFVNETGLWEAQLGGTGNGNFVIVTAGAASLTIATHVVLTCDGTNAALFINGTQAASKALPAGSSFAPNTTADLSIGVGMPYLPHRTKPSDNDFFPLLPFNGKIQDVAIYNVVLGDITIKNHSEHGKGNATG